MARSRQRSGAPLFRRIALWGLPLLIAAPAPAYDGWTSELSHAAGGVAWGGVTTWAVSDVWPEHRALIGFGAAAMAGVIGELYDRRHASGFSTLDVVSSAAGGAIGAYVTDTFILMPVASRSSQGGRVVGVVAHIQF